MDITFVELDHYIKNMQKRKKYFMKFTPVRCVMSEKEFDLRLKTVIINPVKCKKGVEYV